MCNKYKGCGIIHTECILNILQTLQYNENVEFIFRTTFKLRTICRNRQHAQNVVLLTGALNNEIQTNTDCCILTDAMN